MTAAALFALHKKIPIPTVTKLHDWFRWIFSIFQRFATVTPSVTSTRSPPRRAKDDGARARNGCAAGGRRCARTPHRLITMSKSRSSVAGWSAALNALFRAKHPI